MASVIMASVIMASVIMPSVIMANVIMASVTEPTFTIFFIIYELILFSFTQQRDQKSTLKYCLFYFISVRLG